MKLAAAIFLLLCSSGQAATLTWDANPATEPILGYRVYWSAQSRFTDDYGTYDNIFDVGNVTNLLLMPSAGRVYYAVTAYNTELLESEYSDEVFWDWPIIAVPPSRPTNLRITGTNNVAQIRLQQSGDLVTWRETGVAFTPVTNGVAFFRAARPYVPPQNTAFGSKAGKLK